MEWWENAKGVPVSAALIVLLAIVLLGGITVGFSGSIQF